MSTLPNLPRKNNRREAKLDGVVAIWLLRHHPNHNWLLEVKMKGGKYLQHQRVAQKQVMNDNFLWKPPDRGTKNPGDYISLGKGADAIYCVIDGNKVHCEVNEGEVKYDFKI